MSRTSREGFKHVYFFFANLFDEIFMSPSQDYRATVVRQSHDVRVSVANLSPRTLANLQCGNFATLVRMLY